MQISFQSEKIQDFHNMLLSHPFHEYRGFTSMYRGFEVPNLDEEVKMSVLHKLSASNYLQIPSFNEFWAWFRKHHGMKMANQICEFLFPGNDPECQKTINKMRNKKTHPFWSHIKARVYKKWCSIVTEAQCVYSAVAGIEKNQLHWKVFASAELDAVGIDFVIATEQVVIPIQIKKNSFSLYAKSKKNTDENLSRFEMTKKACKILQKEMVKYKMEQSIEEGMLLKYGLTDDGKLPYVYLSQYENGFVYFKSDKLIATFKECLNR
jgi:hypothetical protein